MRPPPENPYDAVGDSGIGRVGPARGSRCLQGGGRYPRGVEEELPASIGIAQPTSVRVAGKVVVESGRSINTEDDPGAAPAEPYPPTFLPSLPSTVSFGAGFRNDLAVNGEVAGR